MGTEITDYIIQISEESYHYSKMQRLIWLFTFIMSRLIWLRYSIKIQT